MSLVYVLLKIKPGHMESVLEKLKKIDNVEEAYMVYGTYDICVKVTTKISQKLKRVVRKIRSQENVLFSLILMGVQ
jgi:DNA-binding Lrp family transcriptional regulator